MSKAAKIVVIDDEAAIRRLLRVSLERAAYAVVEAENARAGIATLGIDRPDLVLLDLGLPDRDGLELVPLIKKAGVALIVISARDETEQKVAALDLGADDYVTKPFDTEEVLARVRTALRHHLNLGSPFPTLKTGDIEIDLASRRVTRDGQEVHLTPKEYGFLAELAKHPGRVVTHAQLLRNVWGPAHDRDVEYLRVAARAVRKKLEADPARPALVINEPGIGYRLMT